jgi:predicted nucleotidyltransferase component of viral defense system
MAFREVYQRQVALLVRVLPVVAKERDFALKGGTAINLFVRDMPRLSVDIDLTFLPVLPRAESLGAIDAAMKRMALAIESGINGSKVRRSTHDGAVTKLIARTEGVQIKIEVTPVLRGTVFASRDMRVVPLVEETFGFAETQVVSFADLYGGKFVAALDRQHPRDLFDVRNLMAAEGIDEALRQAFVVYMLSHGRPMAEVLAPSQKDLAQTYGQEFEGMTSEPVPLDALSETRARLIADIVGGMPAHHRDFMIGFERGQPDWNLLGLPQVAELPAVKWRQQNLDLLSQEKRAALVARLEEVLGGA